MAVIRRQQQKLRRRLSWKDERALPRSGKSWRGTLSKLKDGMLFRSSRSTLDRSSLDEMMTDDDSSVPSAQQLAANKRSVSFRIKANKVHSFATPNVNRQFLWWTSDELAASRTEAKLFVATDEGVQLYLEAMERSYAQVVDDRKLTSETLKQLVHGLAQGHRGYENHTSNLFARRKVHVRRHVRSVVSFYHQERTRQGPIGFAPNDNSRSNCRLNDSINLGSSLLSESLSRINECRTDEGAWFDGSVHAGHGKSTSTAAAASHRLDRNVQKRSSKSSAGSRHFAAAIGKAEHVSSEMDPSPNSRSGSLGREKTKFVTGGTSLTSKSYHRGGSSSSGNLAAHVDAQRFLYQRDSV
jgi:hypothetical protein